MGNTVREPAVSGLFYPADVSILSRQIDEYLEAAESVEPAPKAMIVPHAGYIYSGPVAASAYARLIKVREKINRVILLGPAHRVGFRGLAGPLSHSFRTPLGAVEIDVEQIKQITAQFPQVIQDDRPHAEEHSLEVHLPFLQRILGDFTLVPLVVGKATADEVAEVLEALWNGPETLIVISSDLSHFYDYTTAIKRDTSTSAAIEALHGEDIGPEDACGYLPVRGLLKVASKKSMQAQTIDQRNSGDTAGSKDRVVGYGAYTFS